MEKSKRFIALVLAIFMVAALAGCAVPSGNPSSNASGGDSAPQDSPPDQYESIVRTTQDWPTYSDPAVGNDYSDTITMVNLYDPLLFPGTDGQPVPHIATEWSASADGLEYTFKLRGDVKFHSGNPLTADDVVYSMNRMLAIGEGFAYLYKGLVEKVEAVDPTTVKFTISRQFGPFVSSMIRFMIVDSKLLAEHYDMNSATPYGEFGDYGKNWLLTNDAGSGPYKTKEVKLEEYVFAEKFDDYFKGWEENAPQYFRISGAVEPVSVRTAMANKELEVADQIQPMENLTALDAMEGIDILSYEAGQTFNGSMNTQKAPTDDVHFRKAIAYAFDYDTVMNDIYPGSVQAYGPVATNLPGSTKNLTPYTFDIEKAKAELAQSKYAGDPEMMKIQLVWCAEVPEEEKIALMLAANLSQIGIEVEIIKKPFGSMIADAQAIETTPHLSIVLTAASYFEAGAVLQARYHSAGTGSWEQMEWLMNDEIDALISDALSTVDTEARFQKYEVIQQKLNDLCPTIWMFNMIERRAYQAGYIEWPPVEMQKDGTPFVYPMGYVVYAHDMKVFPDKK